MSRSVSRWTGRPVESRASGWGGRVPLPPVPARIAAAAADLGGGMPMIVAELHAAVAELVRCLRDAGEPPERVLIEVKHELAGVLRYEPSPYTREKAAARLVDQIITWSIESYYSAP